ncbi:MAG: protein kinase [Myxococcota bacterium]
MTTFVGESETAAALAQLSGTVLDGRYALGRVLGAGGMGAVFEGKDERLGRPVAVKVMRPGLAGQGAYIKRFLREAQSASKIRHRNVVVLLDYGEAGGEAEGGLVYSVMEFLVGEDLEGILSDGGQPRRLPWAEACGLLFQVASGLRAVHEQGVIHRDIKPANCFVIQEDEQLVVKLVDFGIAKFDDPGQGQQLTGTAQVLGTPSYIAPELLRTTQPASAQSDVYSLGVLAYRMVSGRLPFEGETAFEVLRKACMDPVPPLRPDLPELPEAAEALVMEMLAKEPEQRPADMLEVRQRLRRLSRPTLGMQAVEFDGSSAIALGDPGAQTSESGAQARLGPGRQGSGTEVTPGPVSRPVGIGARDKTLPSGTVRLDGSTARGIAVPVTGQEGASGAAMPTPLPMAAQSGHTVLVSDESTLSMGDSVAIDRPHRRRGMGLALGGGVLVAVLSGVTTATLLWGDDDARDAEGGGQHARVSAEVEEPKPAQEPEATTRVEPEAESPPTSPATPVLAADTAPASPAEAVPVSSSSGGDATPADPASTVPEPAKPAKTAQKPKKPAGPPSDGALRKKLARRIKSKCSGSMAGKPVNVSFLVNKKGEIRLLSATPRNAAGQCAKQQVQGTKFRTRSADTPFKIVVE